MSQSGIKCTALFYVSSQYHLTKMLSQWYCENQWMFYIIYFTLTQSFYYYVVIYLSFFCYNSILKYFKKWCQWSDWICCSWMSSLTIVCIEISALLLHYILLLVLFDYNALLNYFTCMYFYFTCTSLTLVFQLNLHFLLLLRQCNSIIKNRTFPYS